MKINLHNIAIFRRYGTATKEPKLLHKLYDNFFGIDVSTQSRIYPKENWYVKIFGLNRNVPIWRPEDEHPVYGFHYYRTMVVPQKRENVIWCNIVGFIMWYWLLWHFYYHPEEITGHYPMPDSSKWTDEELGIPPDDYDE